MVKEKMSPEDFRGKVISVRTNGKEQEEIRQKAKMYGLKPAAFLRSLALNYPVKSRVDHLAFLELSKTRADLGRLGGILKMLLGKTSLAENEIKSLLAETLDKQEEITRLAKKMVEPFK